MFVVADSNELFSLLIRGSWRSDGILFSDRADLIAPEFLLIEFSNNREEILSKTHRSEDEFSRLLSIFERRIEFIPREEFEGFIPKASEILKEHRKDVPYFALALRYNCPVWSEEKLLKKQSSVRVFNTFELAGILFVG